MEEITEYTCAHIHSHLHIQFKTKIFLVLILKIFFVKSRNFHPKCHAPNTFTLNLKFEHHYSLTLKKST